MRDHAPIPFAPKPRYTRSSTVPARFWRPALPRPLSWLPRLPAIRRTVAGSPRSHYGRRELERLFEVQPRAAQKLLAALPTVQIGTSYLVERDALLALLDAVQQADDPAAVLTSARNRRSTPAPRTLRQLLPDDRPPTTWETLPASLTLVPGEVRVTFASVEELAAALAALASLLDRDLEAFAERFEPRVREEPASIEECEDAEALVRELELLEKAKAKSPQL